METDAAVQGILDRLAELVEHAESLTYTPPPTAET